jgi:hypothetical protein
MAKRERNVLETIVSADSSVDDQRRSLGAFQKLDCIEQVAVLWEGRCRIERWYRNAFVGSHIAVSDNETII